MDDCLLTTTQNTFEWLILFILITNTVLKFSYSYYQNLVFFLNKETQILNSLKGFL